MTTTKTKTGPKQHTLGDIVSHYTKMGLAS